MIYPNTLSFSKLVFSMLECCRNICIESHCKTFIGNKNFCSNCFSFLSYNLNEVTALIPVIYKYLNVIIFKMKFFIYRFILIVGFIMRRINLFSCMLGKDMQMLDFMYLITEESILMVIYLL